MNAMRVWFIEPVYRDRYGQKLAGYTCGRLTKRGARFCRVVHRTMGAAQRHAVKLRRTE